MTGSSQIDHGEKGKSTGKNTALLVLMLQNAGKITALGERRVYFGMQNRSETENGYNIVIRKLQKPDIDRVADIWLDTNKKAHNFIPAQYWEDNFEAVKEMFGRAEIYVYEDKDDIQGFIGMCEDYIAGIFVWSAAQSNGIGKQLLDFAKSIKKKLRLSVYQKNVRAVNFYHRENFEIQCENTDEDTGEKEYWMIWKRGV